MAKNLLSPANLEGQQHLLLSKIAEHKTNNHAMLAKDKAPSMETGLASYKPTTNDWFLTVEWYDGTSSQVPLKYLKPSNLVKAAKYAAANNLLQKPAFC